MSQQTTLLRKSNNLPRANCGAGKYLAVGATCKHLWAYSLEDSDGYTRHTFNAVITLINLMHSWTLRTLKALTNTTNNSNPTNPNPNNPNHPNPNHSNHPNPNTPKMNLMYQVVTEQDNQETFLPAFQACVMHGKPAQVTTPYT